MNLRFSNSAFAARHSAAPARRRPAPPLSSGVWPPASGVWRLASGVCLLASLLWLPAPVLAAGGGADYGRGPETDPVATAALVSVYAATASLHNAVSDLNAATGSLDAAVSDLNAATGSLDAAVSDLNAATGSLDAAVSDLNAATNYLTDTVYGAPSIASEYSAGVLISTNVITVKNLAGNTVTDYTVMRVWLNAAANAVSHDALEIEKVVDKQNYWIVVTNAGTVTFEVTEAATTTNTINASVGPNIDSESIPLSD